MRSYLTQRVVDVGHSLAGHPRVRGNGAHHVQGEPQVGVPVHIDCVVPERWHRLNREGCEEGRREQTLMSVVIVTMVVMVVRWLAGIPWQHLSGSSFNLDN